MTLNELFDDAIFERVETDDREPAADLEQLQRARERAAQLAELVIDVHAQRLEGAGRGILSGLAGAHYACDQLRQFQGTRQRMRGAVGDDGRGDTPCEAFFS